VESVTADQDRHDVLMQRIGNLLLDVAPPDFRRIDLLVRMTVATHDTALTVYRQDRSTPEVLPPEGLNAAFVDLRRLLYRPGRGTWFSARCVVNAPSRIDITYNLDHDPLFFPPVPASDFARDLQAFPRQEAFIPDWLRRKLAESNDEGTSA
jgi:hypothetical protein